MLLQLDAKNKKVPCTDFSQDLKNLIWSPFGWLLAQKPQKKTCPKKDLINLILIKLNHANFQTYYKNSEKFHALIFDKVWKESPFRSLFVLFLTF